MLDLDDGCKIRRTGSPGSYEYLVDADEDGFEDADRVDRPVNFVSRHDALRFANWMHNGQPEGIQDETTTERGAYTLTGLSLVVDCVPGQLRRPGALVFLPTEDEWYKAVFYKGGGTSAGYWDYPTESDTVSTEHRPGGEVRAGGRAAR